MTLKQKKVYSVMRHTNILEIKSSSKKVKRCHSIFAKMKPYSNMLYTVALQMHTYCPFTVLYSIYVGLEQELCLYARVGNTLFRT